MGVQPASSACDRGRPASPPGSGRAPSAAPPRPHTQRGSRLRSRRPERADDNAGSRSGAALLPERGRGPGPGDVEPWLQRRKEQQQPPRAPTAQRRRHGPSSRPPPERACAGSAGRCPPASPPGTRMRRARRPPRAQPRPHLPEHACASPPVLRGLDFFLPTSAHQLGGHVSKPPEINECWRGCGKRGPPRLSQSFRSCRRAGARRLPRAEGEPRCLWTEGPVCPRKGHCPPPGGRAARKNLVPGCEGPAAGRSQRTVGARAWGGAVSSQGRQRRGFGRRELRRGWCCCLRKMSIDCALKDG